MLTRLLPDQISKHWDVIKYAVEESLPIMASGHSDKMNRVLTSLLCNGSECWVGYEKKDNKVILESIVITKMSHEGISGSKSLFIYCMYGYSKISERAYNDIILCLSKFAKLNKCDSIVAFSNIPNVIENSKRMGADTSYTFLSFNPENSINIINNSRSI